MASLVPMVSHFENSNSFDWFPFSTVEAYRSLSDSSPGFTPVQELFENTQHLYDFDLV
ncbi:predicted protein [Botrytis cinerea T4]|uniref:Uncharacterized protein n=1 Tax=Botryotinia fuckeliana (strain T4) TaxID=999810 RepID=G2XQB8_BOTF4|nr:predicted protein [Botrytis cinerea T4]